MPLSGGRKDGLPARAAAELVEHGEALLLDVREHDEWRAGHAPGAVHIPLGELPHRLAELPRDADVVFYCQTGGRSSRALDLAHDAGFTRAKHLSGGYAQWQRSR